MAVEDYKTNFDNYVHSGMIALAISLGNSLGLIDVMKSLKEPKDIPTIARTAKLNERYVKEWLGCMVAANIVFMQGEDKYFIPEKFKNCLGMSLFSPLVSVMAPRQPIIEGLFKETTNRGQDVYFGEYGKAFFDFQDKERLVFIDERLDKSIIPTLKKYKSEDDFKLVLDAGCGSGITSVAFARRYPSCKVIGMEYSEEALARANVHVQKSEINNVEIVKADITSTPEVWADSYDVIFLFDILHDLSAPDAAITEVKRILKPDGIIIVVEPNVSSFHRNNQGNIVAGYLYAASMFNCLPCSMSSKPSAGLGAGWGFENATEIFVSHNLEVLETSHYAINKRANVFVLRKK